jgi:hypothetical protein
VHEKARPTVKFCKTLTNKKAAGKANRRLRVEKADLQISQIKAVFFARCHSNSSSGQFVDRQFVDFLRCDSNSSSGHFVDQQFIDYLRYRSNLSSGHLINQQFIDW